MDAQHLRSKYVRAIILAAGRGSRLKALTAETPKPLVSFNGIPLLTRTIAALRTAQVDEIGIVVGYRGALLEDLADNVFRNVRWETTGIFHSLHCAEEWLRTESCLVSYGDIFYDATLVSDLIAHPGDIVLGYDPAAVTLWQQRSDVPLSDLENFRIKDGRVCLIGKPALSIDDVQGQYMGLFKITPEGWQRLKTAFERCSGSERDHTDMTKVLSRVIDAGFPVAAVPTYAPWGEIDCPGDIALYERLYPGL